MVTRRRRRAAEIKRPEDFMDTSEPVNNLDSHVLHHQEEEMIWSGQGKKHKVYSKTTAIQTMGLLAESCTFGDHP